MGTFLDSLANGDGLRGWRPRLPRVDPLCSLKVARASKISGRKFSAVARRKPAGLNVCRNGCAEMQCGGPHVASSSPRSIRSQSGSTLGRRAHRHRTVPACWRSSASPFAAAGRRVHDSRASARTRTPSLAIFSTLGDITAMARQSGIGAADRGGGGVRCGLRANGDRPRRVVRLPMADSLCDRMERGEEEAPDAPPCCISAQPFLQT